MLQYLYGETEAAASEIVDAVAPALDDVSKEDIAEASAEKAEEITDAVAGATESRGGKLSEEEYSDIMSACAQVIYTEVMAELATQQACYAMEDLFSDEVIEDYYTSMSDTQNIYSEKPSLWHRTKSHIGRNKVKYSTAVGAYLGAQRAINKGYSPVGGAVEGAIIGALTGKGINAIIARRQRKRAARLAAAQQ